MRSALRVLAYHRIVAADDTKAAPSLVSATPEVFERQMAHLASRYRVVSAEAVLAAQRGERPLPPRAVLLTFDDAYRDFGATVWPILCRYGFPATVFVASDVVDSPAAAFWWDRLHGALRQTSVKTLTAAGLGTVRLDTAADRYRAQRALQALVKQLPHERALGLVDQVVATLAAPPGHSDVHSWSELRALAAEGVTVAGHTCSHAALTQLSAAEAGAEIRRSMAAVRRELGDTLPLFCYPFGLHDDTVVEQARRAAVELAFTCLDGHEVLPSAAPLRLRRTVITRRTTPLIFGLRLTPAVARIDMWRHRGAVPAVRREHDAAGDPDASPGTPSQHVAYVMSRFPKLSETFVLNEMVQLEALGARVAVYPLLRERQPVVHPEVEPWVRRARYLSFISPRIVAAHVHFLRRDPGRYLQAASEALRGTWGSPNFFVGALGIMPKTVCFAREMQRDGVTHIHAHFATHPALAALIVHRLTGIPFSFTAHGSDLHVDRRMLTTKVAAAAFAVTISGFNRDVMLQECGPASGSRLHVVHCGVDPDFFVPGAARPAGEALQLVCVASLEEVKGHRFLIAACAHLHARGIDFRCHLVGAGPLRAELARRIGAAGLTERVLLRGGLPRAEVAALLARADAAVLASHPTASGKKEGIPVALMEAMSCALPVVASAISGIPELVEHEVEGLLVPSGDAVALANALQRLADDPELRARLGTAARLKVLVEFDLQSNARRLLELIAGGGTPMQTPPATMEAAGGAVQPA